jgi:hypothetical protein
MLAKLCRTQIWRQGDLNAMPEFADDNPIWFQRYELEEETRTGHSMLH